MRPLFFLAATLCLAAAAAKPQRLAEGWRATVHELPPGAGQALVLEDNTLVYFTGTELVRRDAAGLTTLLRLAAPVFGAFTRPMGGGRLLFGESSNGDVYLVDAQGTAPARLLARLPFCFDAVLYPPAGAAIVSAKTGGFAVPDNELYFLDLTTGATDLLARLPGASGPVAVGHAGVLYYATASASFPPPPGATELLVFSRAQVLGARGPGHLTRGDARLVAGGFDAASALAASDVEDLFLSDWSSTVVHRVAPRTGRRSVLLDYSGTGYAPADLQFLEEPRSAGAVFAPFQPQAHRLIVAESDFASPHRLRTVLARRPALASSVPDPIPPGRFAVSLAHGPARGHALLFLGPIPAGGPREVALAVPGHPFPVFWAMDLGLPWIALGLPLDAAGAARWELANPGGLGGLELLGQALLLEARPELAGTSGLLEMRLVR